ncbi:hypothetical protein ACLOJK_038337 [Asimina triloba]
MARHRIRFQHLGVEFILNVPILGGRRPSGHPLVSYACLIVGLHLSSLAFGCWWLREESQFSSPTMVYFSRHSHRRCQYDGVSHCRHTKLGDQPGSITCKTDDVKTIPEGPPTYAL